MEIFKNENGKDEQKYFLNIETSTRKCHMKISKRNSTEYECQHFQVILCVGDSTFEMFSLANYCKLFFVNTKPPLKFKKVSPPIHYDISFVMQSFQFKCQNYQYLAIFSKSSFIHRDSIKTHEDLN